MGHGFHATELEARGLWKVLQEREIKGYIDSEGLYKLSLKFICEFIFEVTHEFKAHTEGNREVIITFLGIFDIFYIYFLVHILSELAKPPCLSKKSNTYKVISKRESQSFISTLLVITIESAGVGRSASKHTGLCVAVESCTTFVVVVLLTPNGRDIRESDITVSTVMVVIPLLYFRARFLVTGDPADLNHRLNIRDNTGEMWVLPLTNARLTVHPHVADLSLVHWIVSSRDGGSEGAASPVFSSFFLLPYLSPHNTQIWLFGKLW